MEQEGTIGSAASRMTANVAGLNLRGRTVLVASDGSEAAQKAARIAADLEREHSAVPQIIQVFDLTSYPMPPMLAEAIGVADQLLGERTHGQQRQQVISQLASAVPEAAGWPVHLTAGTPAVQIVSHADRVGAALTVMGLRSHNRLDRIVGDETTLLVQRHSTSPVMAVTGTSRGLPRRIIVGTDFSRASVAAARAALDLAPAGATLTLVHARWPNDLTLGDDEHAVVDELGIASALAHIRSFLLENVEVGRSITIDTIVDSAKPSDLLLKCAESLNGDLIAIASRRYGLVARLMLGSVADELARAARISTLLVPPAV